MSPTDTDPIPGKVDSRWLALLVGIALGGGVGSGVTAAASPDLELARRQAVQEAVEASRQERQREGAVVERRIEELQGQIAGLTQTLGEIGRSQARIEERLARRR